MIDQLVEQLKKDKAVWSEFEDSFVEKEVPSRTVLLHLSAKL